MTQICALFVTECQKYVSLKVYKISSLRHSFLTCYTDFNLKLTEKCKQMRGRIVGKETNSVPVHKHTGTEREDKMQNCMTYNGTKYHPRTISYTYWVSGLEV